MPTGNVQYVWHVHSQGGKRRALAEDEGCDWSLRGREWTGKIGSRFFVACEVEAEEEREADDCQR